MLNLRPTSLAAMILLSGFALNSSAQALRRPYIVQLQDQPAASYTGGIAGLAATRPAPGVVFDYRATRVRDYVRYLGNRKNAVLATVAGAPVLASYNVVLNGFSAMLTEAEVLSLKTNPSVAQVQADVPRRVHTLSTNRFLGLTAPDGLYSQFAGGALIKGENMVIGIIDTGIWPENPAFADRVDANGKPTFDTGAELAYTTVPATFKGGCVAGEGFDPVKHCNNKLIGAKYYNNVFTGVGHVRNWSEFNSPRDSNIGYDGVSSGDGGHGNHTASTAAGNAGVPAFLNDRLVGDTAGIAPRARVAAYKVCWTYDDTANPDASNSSNTCYQGDSVTAIEEAVKDGVNVINYSIGGFTDTSADAVAQAFYRATLANVFVAASANNSGPANTVEHLGPWLTTVGASTHSRFFASDVAMGSGSKVSGASLNALALGPAPLIRAQDAALGAGDASLCYGSAATGIAPLDPAKVAGKIVVCTRGGNGRTQKSLAVLNAGGVGMVLVDNGSGVVSEAHSVPTVHVSAADGAIVQTYAAAPGATASLAPYVIQTVAAPVMANFSSRGPNQSDNNILKPDLTAPGVDIIASATPRLTPAQHAAVADGSMVPPAGYAMYGGTSMSSPHVAGLALLIRQAHPDWSPAAVKSALMTTAYSTRDDGLPGAQNGMLPWAQGAGHVDPNKAINPGLVYDAGAADFIQYQCNVNRALVLPASDCTTFGTLDETYNLNLASITVGSILDQATVRRRVTNVGGATATYNASASVSGFATLVTPSSLTLAPGESASFTVKLSPAGAALNEWNFGSLSWTDGNQVVRSPIQARLGEPILAPALLTSEKVSGSKLFPVKTAFSGRMGALKGGLKNATLGDSVTLTPSPLEQDQLKLACQAGVDTASVKVYNFPVPAGTIVARFALRQSDTGAGSDDNDLAVLAPNGEWRYSANEGSDESAQFDSPAAGSYKVCVLAWGSENDQPMSHQLSSWIVTPADSGGKFTLGVPGKVVAGNNTTVAMSWSGLARDGRYVGGAQFLDLGGVVRATTVIHVNTGTAAMPSRAAAQRAKLKK